ncbi:redox-sensitive transcriptional activator SoxR [Litorimonas sp. RW-G-Af-16]|uniref:redox-sensitive transcriptional activator SoxR n=1 Tax=Litorimonas sp. RW-G-Af-16 TaxID=3241168 RepID=UPI00390C4E90
MKRVKTGLSIGKVAARTGVAVSALRFYEEAGLVLAGRNAGGQRVFEPSDIRRISFVIIAQKLGFSLKQIKGQLDALPNNRTPTKQDWEKISRDFGQDIDARIDALTTLKRKLTGCIGCGCLSLKSCAIYNADDAAAAKGAGPRFLMGDNPEI